MLAILLAITLVGAGALFVLFKTEKTGEAATVDIDEVVESSLEVPELTTNLLGGDLFRIALTVHTDSKDTKEELEKRSFQIKNIIIKQLSDMTEEDLKGSQGKENFETTLKEEINDLISDGEVVQVYITTSLHP